MAFHNEIRAEKAIWRPYLDSDDDFTVNQRSADNPELSLERATLRSYHVSEDDDKWLLKQRNVESYKGEGRYVDSSSVNNVTLRNTGRNFQYNEHCPLSIGDHVLHERYKQTCSQNSFWKTHIQTESERDNYTNLTQTLNECNTHTVTHFANNFNSLSNFDFIERDLKSKIYGQMILENDQMLMDKEILKTYYEQETRYNESVWQELVEYNRVIEKTDGLIHMTKDVNTKTDITVNENGIKVIQRGQIGPEDNQLLMDKDVLKTYYDLEKGNDSCGLNIEKDNQSTHLGIDIPNMVNTVTDVANIQNDLQSKNNGQWCMEDIPRLIRSVNQTQHVQKHSSDQSKTKLQCKYCKKNIVGKSNLKRHIKTIHEEPFNRPHHCSKCDSTFKSNSCLKTHMKSHQRIQTFKYACPECKTGFNNAEKFRRHMRTDNPDIKCDICNLTFRYKGCYEIHQRDHVGVERCMNKQDNTQLEEEASVHEDITTTMNSRPYQDDEVERENIIEPNEVSSTKTTKTHPIDCDTTFQEVTLRELNRGNVGRRGMKFESDKLMKADLINDINPLNRKDAVEPETDGEIRNEIIHREPSMNDSEVRTTFGHLDSACVIDECLLTTEDINAETGDGTTMDPHDDFNITADKRSKRDFQKSSMVMDNCTKRSMEEGSGDKVNDEVNKIKTSNSSPCGAGEQRHEDIKNKLKAVENRIIGDTTTNSSRKMFKCSICEKTFSTKISLNRHQVIHTGQKDYHCDVCGKAFALKDTLIIHLRRHSGEKPYKCGQCGKAFCSSSGLATHKKSHSSLRPYKCEICSRTFKSKSHLRDHINFAHTSENALKCDVCDARFTWRAAYRNHIKKHTGDNENYKQPKLQCQLCYKFYSGKASLHTHIKSVHEKIRNKPYHCGECGANIKRKSLLKAHMEKHSSKPTLKYSCAHCYATFKTSHYLRLHMRMHVSDVFYKCDICNIAFKLHKCFMMHQKKHAA